MAVSPLLLLLLGRAAACVVSVWSCLCRRIAPRLALPRSVTGIASITSTMVKSQSQPSLGPIRLRHSSPTVPLGTVHLFDLDLCQPRNPATPSQQNRRAAVVGHLHESGRKRPAPCDQAEAWRGAQWLLFTGTTRGASFFRRRAERSAPPDSSFSFFLLTQPSPCGGDTVSASLSAKFLVLCFVAVTPPRSPSGALPLALSHVAGVRERSVQRQQNHAFDGMR